MEPSTTMTHMVIRLEKAGLACLVLIIAMTTTEIKQANQDQTCLAEETSMMLMETKQAIQCKDSLGIIIIMMMTDKMDGGAEFPAPLFLHKQK